MKKVLSLFLIALIVASCNPPASHPGSFSELVTVRIFSGAESDNVYNNLITGLYRIEGLPDNFTKPVELALKYAGSLANESYLAMGYEVEVIESEEPSFTPLLFEARDSSGYLVSHLEPPVASLVSEGPMKKGTSNVYSKFLLMGLSNMSSIETPYFRLVH